MTEMNNDQQIQKPTAKIDSSRRRLAKAALIGAPILMTLPGRSALAGNCTSLSGQLSGNLSPQGGSQPCGGTIQYVSGRSPGYWRTVCNNTHKFPLGYEYKQRVNTCGYGVDVMYVPSYMVSPDFTILEALWLKLPDCKSISSTANSDALKLTQHTIAALFNAVSYSDYFIGPKQVVQIYNAIIAGGTASGVYHEPTTGEKIDCQTIISIYEASYVGDATPMTGTLDCADAKLEKDTGYVYIKEIDGKYRCYHGGYTYVWNDATKTGYKTM